MKTSIRQTGIALLTLVGFGIPGIGLAQSYSAESRIGHWYIGGGFGAYAEEDNPQLSSQDAGAAFFFSGGYRASPNIAVEADALVWNQDFAAPSTIPNAQGHSDLTSTPPTPTKSPPKALIVAAACVSLRVSRNLAHVQSEAQSELAIDAKCSHAI